MEIMATHLLWTSDYVIMDAHDTKSLLLDLREKLCQWKASHQASHERVATPEV
jgi:hypothetical protein